MPVVLLLGFSTFLLVLWILIDQLKQRKRERMGTGHSCRSAGKEIS
jgi:hypothetical protein